MSEQSKTPQEIDAQCCQAEVLTPEQARIRQLERDSDILHNDCIIEIAVRNKGVSEWMEHWEGRAIKAETSLADARAALLRLMKSAGTHINAATEDDLCLAANDKTDADLAEQAAAFLQARAFLAKQG